MVKKIKLGTDNNYCFGRVSAWAFSLDFTKTSRFLGLLSVTSMPAVWGLIGVRLIWPFLTI
jgi:hypothetical protein